MGDANTWGLIQGYDASTAPFTSSASDAGLGIPTASNDMFASSKLADYFKTQALLGGKMEFGAMFGNNQQSTCPAEEVSVNCMPPSSSSFTDFLGIHKEKALCQAKGCCWDQSRQNNNAFGLTRYTCSWNPEWSIYNKFSFLPSLTQSLRGCCALSACVQPEARATQHDIPAAPVAVVEAAPIVNDSAPAPSQSLLPQSTTPSTASGKRPLAPSHAVVVSSPNTVTASQAVTHSATSVNSSTTTHATNTLASMVFHWVPLARSLVANK